MRSSVEVAMRPESFNLSRLSLLVLVCTVSDFSISHYDRSMAGFLPPRSCFLNSARHMCVQRRAISMLGRLKDYLYVPRSSPFGNCLLITKHRCRLLHLRRCMKRWRQTLRDHLTVSYCSYIPQSKYEESVELQHRSTP